MEIKDLENKLQELKTGLEAKAKADATEVVNEQLKAVNDAILELKEKPSATPDELKAIKEDVAATVKGLQMLSLKMKGQSNEAKPEQKTFNENLAELIKENADQIKGFKVGSGEKRFEMKAVGEMSIAANYANLGSTLVETRPMIEKPYNRVWLGDLLPAGTSNAPSILYPKENGGEGGAALWTDKTTDKPLMDFDFTGQSAYMKWIAGIVIIEREMLDDIPFLTSYLQQKMLISLKIAENDFILNGSADTNPVAGLLDAATAYNGTMTTPVNRIVDAAWGQLVDGTFDFYNPTTVIMTNRDSVAIGLNQAEGSGEYNLPAGSVAFAGGQLTVAGIDVVRTTQIGAGNFLAFDKNATMFIKRMQPELRMFEDAALAKKNKIMFRVEERATLAVFNNAALVQGTLAV